MKRFLLFSAVALPLMVSAAALAQCVTKRGQGTGLKEENAAFQAWEAMLQNTDWSAWGHWMVTSQNVGTAPGFSVSDYKMQCAPGGLLGYEWTARARLCKTD